MSKSQRIQFLSGVLSGVLLWAIPAAAGPRRFPARISPLSDSLRKTSKVPDPAAHEAFRNFAKKTGTSAWRVRYSPKTALPEAIVGAKTHRYPGTPGAAAIAFLNDNKDLLKVDVSQLRQAYSKIFMGVTHIQYEQIYNSIPVEFAYVRVHVNSLGEVTGYQAKFEPDINVSLSPAFSAAYAENSALSDLGFSARVTAKTLVLFPDPASDGALKLAWKIRARAADAKSGVWLYYVGAGDGKILFRYNDLRYVCPELGYAAGSVKGTVYRVSPIPSGDSTSPRESWTQPVSNTPISNQYVWITSTLDSPPTRVVSEAYSAADGTVAGDYCGTAAGKVFASLKGPYFSVVNFRGPSAHFDNGVGVWQHVHHTPSITKAALNMAGDYSFTVQKDWASTSAFAKVMPHFASFSVGAMDQAGTITDPDELHMKDGNSIVASYIGTRSQPFFGAAVENRTYGLALETDNVGTVNEFSVDISSYLVLTDHPTDRDNSTGSIVWSTNTARVFLDSSLGNVENALAEVNVFYHLNTVYEYFKRINMENYPTGTPFADLSKQVPVMVHAHGAADTIATAGGMENAFYDLEKDNIFLGDGRPDSQNNYRSFALDGTIIRHEYTHRVVNQIYPMINFGEFGAVSEAMADYFSLASFRREGCVDCDISVLGNFVGTGEGVARNLAGAAKAMPADWSGEVHDDSLILSQALWQLKNSTPTTATDLGNFGPTDTFPGMPKADAFAYAALFYFPDNFTNFYDAFVAACTQLDPAGCPGDTRERIRTAFSGHGIPSYDNSAYIGKVDGYDQSVPDTKCGNNNGPECATDISTMTRLSATIYPAGDVDYYSIPLQEGDFTAVLDLPSAAVPDYYAYSMLLFDADRNVVHYPNGDEVIAAPVITNSYGDCPSSGDCFTNSPSVSLTYSVTSPGRYYLVVSGSLNEYGGNSRVASLLPYSLNLSYAPKGSASANILTARYDQDTISFTVPYAKFPESTAPSDGTLTADESVFDYAQLRDHNYQPLADTRARITDDPNSLLSVVGPPWPAGGISLGKTVIEGSVHLKTGFALRYPGVGTVYLEIFGKNHMGGVISLGVSNAINLTTNKSDLITYNNILDAAGDRAVVKYDLQSAGNLTIKIYTVTGSLVKTLFSGSVSAGKGAIDWDGTNISGSKVVSGIYYVKAKGPGLDAVDKIAVVR